MDITAWEIIAVLFQFLIAGIIATVLILALALLIIESIKAIRKAIKNGKR